MNEQEIDECPLGGDITNNCADCIYSDDYEYKNGECIRRSEQVVDE